MERAIANYGIINGNAITGNNNVLNISYMSTDLNKILKNLEETQLKLTNIISDSIEKRAEADLLRAKVDMLAQENRRDELKIRKKELINNENLIDSIQTVINKIYEKLI